jgi:hypothetical protein
MQPVFEPMRKQVEAWQRSELTDVAAKVVIYGFHRGQTGGTKTSGADRPRPGPLMWRRDLCGARLGNAPKDTLFGVDKRHITFRSETAKELHDAWVLAPHLSLVPFPAGVTGRQRLRFHLKIDFGVDIGGVDGNVSQPRPDCVDVYAST